MSKSPVSIVRYEFGLNSNKILLRDREIDYGVPTRVINTDEHSVCPGSRVFQGDQSKYAESVREHTSCQAETITSNRIPNRIMLYS